MKNWKLRGLGIAIAVGLAAFVGAGSAAAKTVFCSTTSTPCSSPYKEGTKYDATLLNQAKLEIGTTGETFDECKKETVRGSLTKEKEETVFLGITQLTLEECERAVKTLVNGEFEVHHIAGTDNGTVTAYFTEITVVLLGVSCVYGAGEGVNFGTITGSLKSPIFHITGELPRVAGGIACPATATWDAEAEFSEPRPLFVES